MGLKDVLISRLMVGQSVDMRVLGKIWLGYSAGVMGRGGEWEEQVRGHGLSTRRLSQSQGHLDPLERDTLGQD